MDENNACKFKYGTKRNCSLTPKEKAYLSRKRDEWMDREIEYYEFAETNTLAYDLRKGEIYEIDWGMNINAEFSGRHYGVVLADSEPNNPLVVVCPLKTNHKTRVNPKSDVLVGKVKGLNDEKETVAVVNQIRTIDKMRIFTQTAIGLRLCDYRSCERYGNECTIIRLEENELNKILKAASKLLYGIDISDD